MLSLDLTCTSVVDLSPLAEMKALERLELRLTRVADISVLRGKNELRSLDLFDTRVTDLSPLAQTSNINLELGGSAVEDLAPLVGMQNATIVLYRNQHQAVPKALESRSHQLQLVTTYR
jgi:internalin A